MSDSVIKEIAAAIHVRQIQTPMGMAKPFTRHSKVGQVATHMDRVQHDVTPVFPAGDTLNYRGQLGPDGTLRRVELEGLDNADDIRSVVRPLSGDLLIDSKANLLEMLDRFRADHTFLLVVGSGGLNGIVTPSDMNKQAGRTHHLFMHVSALELALAERLRAAKRSDEDVLRLMTPKRAGMARGRLGRQQSSNQSADLVATLDFQDLLLVERELGASGFISHLSLQQIEQLSDFRNRVMHSVLQPAGDDPERLDELLVRTELVERLLGAIEEQSVTAGY